MSLVSRELSAAEEAEEPEEEREAKAQEKAGDDGEVESGVFAVVDDVAGQAAEAKGQLAGEVEKRADGDEDDTGEKQEFAEVTERVHGEHCNEKSATETQRY